MAKIKQGILGGFSGKVAGVVGTSWKGRAVMKSRPLSVSNPKTDAQVEQRGKFSDIAELASKILTTFVQPVENPISGDISGYNKFVRDNKGAFDGNHELVAADFVCGGGKLPFAESTSTTLEISGGTTQLGWSNAAGTSAIRLTDKAYAAAFTEDGSLLGVSSGTATRNSGAIDFSSIFDISDLSSGDKVYFLLAFVSADGRDVSVMANAVVGTVED